MYCPRCGRQPASDALRFCSYCGFKLGVVKASLADEDDVSGNHFTVHEIPKERQRYKQRHHPHVRRFLVSRSSGWKGRSRSWA